MVLFLIYNKIKSNTLFFPRFSPGSARGAVVRPVVCAEDLRLRAARKARFETNGENFNELKFNLSLNLNLKSKCGKSDAKKSSTDSREPRAGARTSRSGYTPQGVRTPAGSACLRALFRLLFAIFVSVFVPFASNFPLIPRFRPELRVFSAPLG